MTEPTPRPWKVQYQSAPGGVDMYWLVPGKVSVGSNNPADARLIVKAVNCHDELVAAMQEFVDRCERKEVLSEYTYAKFKALLAKIREQETTT